jgi:hypothetical protein
MHMQGRYEVQMPYAKTARLINLFTYWFGYDRSLTAEEWAVFPTDLVRATTLVTHFPPALPHEKDNPILSGVQEGLKVWIKYHIGRGPRLKWSNMYVRAAGELILEARHQICCATLPAVVAFRDCRCTLRSFSIFECDKVILYRYSMDNYTIN